MKSKTTKCTPAPPPPHRACTPPSVWPAEGEIVHLWARCCPCPEDVHPIPVKQTQGSRSTAQPTRSTRQFHGETPGSGTCGLPVTSAATQGSVFEARSGSTVFWQTSCLCRYPSGTCQLRGGSPGVCPSEGCMLLFLYQHAQGRPTHVGGASCWTVLGASEQAGSGSYSKAGTLPVHLQPHSGKLERRTHPPSLPPSCHMRARRQS